MDALGNALDEGVRFERATAAIKAKVVAAADRARLAGETGAVDTIALPKDRAQLSGREAKRSLDLGRRLERLPGTTAALADGELGVEQAEQVALADHTGWLGMPGQAEACCSGARRRRRRSSYGTRSTGVSVPPTATGC